MAKPIVDENSDGLEITSIGSLYRGPWDKKYWSSSRGKDRYPYPIGYQVIRALNGSTYKMEIHEGLKGPLFVIASDGYSCSAQTPDIAWEKFQKKGCPRMKIWHGKRFSCKIDGVEFFGFKNPLVQRLLRELLSDINGTADQSLISSSFCNSTTKTDYDHRVPDACTYPDLLPYLVRPLKTGKRSRKLELINMKSITEARLKRSRPQDLVCNAEASSLIQRNNTDYYHGYFMPPSALKEEDDIFNHPGASPSTVHIISGTAEEKNHFSAKDKPPVNSVDSAATIDWPPLNTVNFSDHPREEAVPAQEEKELDGSENCKSTGVANNLPAEEETPGRPLNFFQLSRLPDTEVEKLNLHNARQDQSGYPLIPKGCPGASDVDLCAPDTFDLMEDYTSNSGPIIRDKSTCGEKEELTAADMVLSQGLVIGSHLQEEICSSNSNGSSEKNEYDSVGQETAKSMMAFLLPQAVPLLKKASGKEKALVSTSKNLSCMVKSQNENNEARCLLDVPSPDAVATLTGSAHMEKEEMMHIQMVGPGVELTKPVVLDSFEEDQCGDLLTKQVKLSSDIADSDQVTFDKDNCPPGTWGQVSVQNESFVSHVKTFGSKEVSCCNKVYATSNEKPQEGDVCVTESVLVGSSPSNEVLPGNINAFANLDEKPVEVDIQSKQKHIKTVHDCTGAHPDTYVSIANDTSDINQRGMIGSSEISWKEINFKRVLAEPGIATSTQIPNKVYTRKKVRNVDLLAGKDNVPLSESIIYRNFGEHLDLETDPATGTLLASEIHDGSSDNKPGEEGSFGVQARVGGQSHISPQENTTINSKSMINDLPPAVSQNQAFGFVSNDEHISGIFRLSVSHVRKPKVHLEKKLVGHKNCVDSNNPTSFLNKNASFCENNSPTAKESQVNRDMKLDRKVELNYELLGCYVHPMSISSVLLRTKGNEIYICVLCGLLRDRDRNLLIYKLAIKEPRVGFPSFVGHTSITFPILKDYIGREVELERSAVQFTPDCKHLVLLDSISTPYCREGRVQCLCSTCTSNCLEKNAIKIVQVKSGYVSVVVTLRTDESLRCLLVCEPNHLVAVGESGELHLWVMNSAWSGQTEELILPANNSTSPGIMELKGVPNCTSLVVGHNNVGEFSIWDISKRIFLSSFSAPSTLICQFFPISLFNWKSKGPLFTGSNVKEHINGIMTSTKMGFPEETENSSFLPLEGQDIAVWLLVSTISDSDAQRNYVQGDFQNNSEGRWRLALLVKDKVVLGRALDPSTSAVGASAGRGIVSTCDGHVYMWELSTGTKLGVLHHFKDGSVSCVATDDSRAGALAVADDRGQLVVYLQSCPN